MSSLSPLGVDPFRPALARSRVAYVLGAAAVAFVDRARVSSGRRTVSDRGPAARRKSATPTVDVAMHRSSAPVTSTTCARRRRLMAKAAAIPRAPVIAFQPAIAAARVAIGVSLLTAA